MLSIILKEYEDESLNNIHGLTRNKKERRQEQRSEVKGERERKRREKEREYLKLGRMTVSPFSIWIAERS